MLDFRHEQTASSRHRRPIRAIDSWTAYFQCVSPRMQVKATPRGFQQRITSLAIAKPTWNDGVPSYFRKNCRKHQQFQHLAANLFEISRDISPTQNIRIMSSSSPAHDRPVLSTENDVITMHISSLVYTIATVCLRSIEYEKKQYHTYYRFQQAKQQYPEANWFELHPTKNQR